VGAALKIGRLRHENDVGAPLARLGNRHDVFDAAQVGFARAGDDAGMFGSANGTTPTGLPRSAERACCSTEAKKPSKSR
jgi:hypothetical protein